MDTPDKEKNTFDEPEKSKQAPSPRVLPRFYFLAVIVGAIVYGIGMMLIFQKVVPNTAAHGDIATAAFLVFVPFGIGVISTFAIAPAQRTIWNVIGVALLTTVIFMIVAGLMFSGIWLCLLMIAPF